MRRLLRVLVLVFAGLVLSTAGIGVGLYQAEQCAQNPKNAANQPAQKQNITSGDQSDKQERKPPEEAKHTPYFGCGITGVPYSLVGFMDHHEGFFVGGFTFFLVIATILLWWETNNLYDAGERQMNLTRKSVNTAITANQIAVTNAEQQLRAYVAATGGEILPHRQPTTMGANQQIEGRPHTYGVSVSLKNGGQTPAVNVKVNVSCKRLARATPDSFNFPDSDLFGYGVIGPQTAYQTPTIHVPANELESIDGVTDWFFWGWIEYDDIFDGSPKHRTEFCFQIERIRFPQTGSIAMGFMPYPRFNAVDFNCSRPFWPNENVYADQQPKA